MKSFRRFIIEARETLASTQAKNRGWKSDSHGDYYNAQGKLVAKTIGGELKIFTGRPGGEDNQPKQKNKPVQVAPQQQQIQPQQTGATEGKGIVVLFGRFNPPAKSHESILKYGLGVATENQMDYRVYPSRIQDYGTNPLNPTLKIQYMQKMFPTFADYIIDSSESRSIFDVLSSLYSDGYKNVKVVVGADRLGEFQSLANRNQGKDYQFDNLEVIPSPMGDPDSEAAGGGSSAALRKAAIKGNFNAFTSNLPNSMNSNDKEDLYKSILKSMKLGEGYDRWRVSPELDMEGLRVNYKKDNIYSVGTLVENINTGVSGRVMRRGTNYLICVSESGVMFKSWLQNMREVQ